MLEAELEHVVLRLVAQFGGEASGHRPGLNPRAGDKKKMFDQLKGRRGFPDLVIVSSGRFFIWELKQDGAYLRPDQRFWRDRLVTAGAPYAVIRPREFRAGLVEDALRGREVVLPVN